jgi:hypothetical protein
MVFKQLPERKSSKDMLGDKAYPLQVQAVLKGLFSIS